MAISLEDYRLKLINKILSASSQDDVKKFVGTAIRSLKENKVHDHVITRFILKTIARLEVIKIEIKDLQQSKNIQTSRIELYNISFNVQSFI